MISIRKLVRDTTYKIKNLLSPIKEEKFSDSQIQLFRDDVNRYFLHGNYADSWTKFAGQMKESFIAKNPSDFLQWELIKYTITSFNSTMVDQEYAAIKANSVFFLKWNNLLLENGLGSPERFWKYRAYGTNKIHQTYHLLQLFEKFNLDLSQLTSVLEFGGGYGNMCALFQRINPAVKYTIFDLPELLCLQKFYLNALKIPCAIDLQNKVTLTKDLEMVKAENNAYSANKLFIATWSLSESPFELRDNFIPIINTFEFILIAYQQDFDAMGNVSYFKTFQEKLNEHTWIEYPVVTMKGSYYLLGKRK